MTPRECSELLTYASIIDNRTVAPETVQAWMEVLGHLDVTLARQAIIQHRRESTEYLMPAHVIRGAQRLRAASRAIESAPTCSRHPGYILTRLEPICARCQREEQEGD
ncbi:hypothetical protein B0T42_07365 [Rathayibacter sp. VKM Ac-2630]|nr:hypothetical protein B0T42_07365 [Rathayibacter sp. VKM Ac-2630]